MGGGAWPFLVRGVICVVNSGNERDLSLRRDIDTPVTLRAAVCIGGKPHYGGTLGDESREA